MPARTFLLVASLLALPLLGQPSRNPPTPAPRPADTLAAPRTDSRTQAPETPQQIPASQDSLSRPKSRADTVLVVQHRFHHREQIITGSVVMICLALMMVVMNNYNPR